jgi:hypothetical protein
VKLPGVLVQTEFGFVVAQLSLPRKHSSMSEKYIISKLMTDNFNKNAFAVF